MDGKKGLEKDDKDNQINKTIFCMKKKHTDQEPSGGKKKVKKTKGFMEGGLQNQKCRGQGGQGFISVPP